MKDRITTLLSALAALVLVIILLSPPSTPPVEKASTPTSTNSGRYGLLGLKRWLDQAQVPNMSLRSRYSVLFSGEQINASGNLLISSSPTITPAREQELEYLLFWLSQGNDLLLLSADSDAPQWVTQTLHFSEQDLLAQLGFQLLVEKQAPQNGEQDQEQDDNNLSLPRSLPETLRNLSKQIDEFNYQTLTLTPQPGHPLTKHVNSIHARTLPLIEPPTHLLGIDWPRNALVLLRDAKQQPAMWEVRVGAGRIWISRFADLFGNVSLGEKDNATLIANMVATSLQPGGRVIFDDMHFGVSDLYDPETFFSDSRLHNTLWFILVFWLLYVVGYGNRFSPPTNKKRKIQNIDFTYAVGGYFARRLTSQNAAMALFQHFFNDIRAHYKQPLNGEPVWELLKKNPRLDTQTLGVLLKQYNSLTSKRKFNLIKLRNQLLNVRKQITS